MDTHPTKHELVQATKGEMIVHKDENPRVLIVFE